MPTCLPARLHTRLTVPASAPPTLTRAPGAGTLLLVLRPEAVLSLVLPAGAPATAEAVRYLRLRSLSLVPARPAPEPAAAASAAASPEPESSPSAEPWP